MRNSWKYVAKMAAQQMSDPPTHADLVQLKKYAEYFLTDSYLESIAKSNRSRHITQCNDALREIRIYYS